MKKHVTVIVTGETAAGKSSVMYLIETLLRDNGYTVEVDLENQHDYDKSIYHFHNAMSYHKEERFAALKENVKITLKEMPMRNAPQINEKYENEVKANKND
jgi:adenylylsulfate kinase-like enzyme